MKWLNMVTTRGMPFPLLMEWRNAYIHLLRREWIPRTELTGRPYESIGLEIGLSHERVRQIHLGLRRKRRDDPQVPPALSALDGGV